MWIVRILRDVIVRLDRAIQHSRGGSRSPRGRDVLDLPLSRAMTIEGAASILRRRCAAFSRRDSRPSLARTSALQEEGAGKAGYRLIPMARVQQKMHAAVTTGFSRNTRPSLRNGFTAYTYSPRGPGFLAPVTRRSFCSLDTSVGVSGPHDFAVRSSAVRPHEEIMRVAVASIASRLTFRDDSAYAPLAEAGRRGSCF